MAIRPTDKRRLARLAGPRIWEERRAVERRVELCERVSFCDVVGVLLEMEGIDPETTCIPARLRKAQAELNAISDSEELEKADEAYLARTSWVEDWQPRSRYRPPRAEEPVEREIERLMQRYRTDLNDSDPTKMSAFDLCAWCLSRHGESYEEAAAAAQKAARNLLLAIDGLPEDPTDEDIERAVSALENQ